jgi:hypothetical protein
MNHAVEPQTAQPDRRWWKSARSLGEIAELVEVTLKDKQQLERKLSELAQENGRLSESLSELQSRPGGKGRQQAELAARERLIRDEYERKAQALQLEFNKERRLLADRFKKMQDQMAGCICRLTDGEGFTVVSRDSAPVESRPSKGRRR